MVFSPATKELAISWTDAFPTELGYRVEKQGTATTWEAVESLPASANTGASVSWKGTLAQSSTYRVVVVRDGYIVPLEASPGVTTGAIELNSTIPAIHFNQPLPLRAPVRFSVVGAGSATAVRYLIDGTVLPGAVTGRVLGPYTSAPDFSSESQAPASFGLGGHHVDAFLSIAPGVEIRLQRNFDVANPNPEASWRYLTQVDADGVFSIMVNNGRSGGFRTLQVFVNGTAVPLTYESIVYGQWSATVDASSWPRGPVTLRLLGTDYYDLPFDESWSVMIDRTPRLTLDSPANGAIVQGSLQMRGAVTDDSTQVTTTVHLASNGIFQTTQLTFDQAVSLAGIPAGSYALDIVSRDTEDNVASAGRTVFVVPPDSPFTYHRVVDSLPNVAGLLDSEGTTMLYRRPSAPDNALRVIRRSSAGDEIVLEESDTFDLQTTWDLSGNRVAAVGTSAGTRMAVLYDASGTLQQLPYTAGTVSSAVLDGASVVWGGQSAYVRNLDSGGPDAGPIDIGTPGFAGGIAFAGPPGAERLFFSRTSGPGQISLYFFDRTTETTTQFTPNDGRYKSPQSDGVRVAWAREGVPLSPPYSQTPPDTLFVASFANPGPASTTQLSTQMLEFRLADGTLAWTEPYQNSRVLKVDDASGTIVASEGFDIEIYGTSGGHVLFAENDKVYLWSRSAGKRLLLPGTPHRATINGGVVFLVTGFNEGQSIYRVDL
jgi:hypothetical protein